MTERFKDLIETVKWVLMNEIEARSDDQLLIVSVDSLTNSMIANYSYPVVAKYRYKFGLYPVESITRTARQVKRQYPELRGTEEDRKARKAKEKEYRELAKAKV